MRRLGLLVSAGLAILVLIPASFLPASLAYSVDEERAAPGAVRYTPPGPNSTPYTVAFDLTAGRCELSRLDAQGRRLEVLGAQVATFEGRVQRGESLLIACAEGARGPYRVSIGSQLFGINRTTRVYLLAATALSAALAAAGRRLKLERRIALRRRLTFAAAALVSGLVVYSVIHELGHYILGAAFGGRVREVVWTLFEGAEPHVSFASLPPGAGPSMKAGGVFLPTAVGLAAILLWFGLRERLSWLGHTCLLTPACVLLAGNLGLLAQDDHLGELMGATAVAVPLLSVAVLALVALRLRTLFGNGGATERPLRRADSPPAPGPSSCYNR